MSEIQSSKSPDARGLRLRRWTRCLGVLVFCLLLAAPGFGPQTRTPDVIYVPTDQAVVDEMLRMAKVAKDSVVYDLGCGDGRIVITAARRYGARGVGIDIDPDRIAESKENARSAGVAGRVRFVQADLFQTDFHEATAVMLYLLTSLNVRLRPILLRQLKPGTPVVSHDFMMGDWQPDDDQLRQRRRHLPLDRAGEGGGRLAMDGEQRIAERPLRAHLAPGVSETDRHSHGERQRGTALQPGAQRRPAGIPERTAPLQRASGFFPANGAFAGNAHSGRRHHQRLDDGRPPRMGLDGEAHPGWRRAAGVVVHG